MPVINTEGQAFILENVSPLPVTVRPWDGESEQYAADASPVIELELTDEGETQHPTLRWEGEIEFDIPEGSNITRIDLFKDMEQDSAEGWYNQGETKIGELEFETAYEYTADGKLFVTVVTLDAALVC